MPFWTSLGNTLKDMSAGLPVIGGLIQSNINAKVARENTDKTIAANRAMAEYQYQKDLEMWNKGNMYNSPLEQMRRLKAAGLNPNMVYGSGSAAGMSAGQLPKYNAPTADYNYVPPVDIPSTIGMFQDFRLRSAQIRNQEQQYTERNQPMIMSDGVVKPYYQVKAINEQTDKQYGWQVKQAEWERRRQPEWIHMPRYQSDVYKEQARKLQLEQDRLVAATRNLDLQNEYFAAKAITDMFGKGIGAMKGIGSMFNRGGGAKAMTPAGKLSSGTVRYNSPTSWERMLRDRK
jgi:hypothetical protein